VYQPKTSKRILLTLLVLLLVYFLFDTPMHSFFQSLSCRYTVYIDSVVFPVVSYDTVRILSDSMAFYMLSCYSFVLLLFSHNRLNALMQVCVLSFAEAICAFLKSVWIEERPIFTCSAVNTGYCAISLGMPATHVFTATVFWLHLGYYGVLTNSFFKDKPRLRGLLFVLCLSCVEVVDQTRLIMGAHFFSQDIYAILFGGIFFFFVHVYFYPWVEWVAENPRMIEPKKFVRLLFVILLAMNFLFVAVTWLDASFFTVPAMWFDQLEAKCGLSSTILLSRGFWFNGLLYVYKVHYSFGLAFGLPLASEIIRSPPLYRSLLKKLPAIFVCLLIYWIAIKGTPSLNLNVYLEYGITSLEYLVLGFGVLTLLLPSDAIDLFSKTKIKSLPSF
jgi:PAP2 superfamily